MMTSTSIQQQIDEAVAGAVPAMELLQEYFQLKDRDREIRKIRNTFMADNHCLNLDRPSSSYKDQTDYEDNGGECIRREVGMGGYPAPLCEVCQKRNAWYTERQQLSHRRAAIMRKLKRLAQQPKPGRVAQEDL